MAAQKSFRNFIIVWIGQFVSILGSGLSSFGLSVWIYYETGAATPFALSFFCAILPRVLFAPFAGSIADRQNRKIIIMLTDTLDAVLKVMMAVLLFGGRLDLWVVYTVSFLSSALSTFQGPAFMASLPMLVEKKDLQRANGMFQLVNAAQSLIAPVLAGALYPLLKLQGLLIIDFISFFAAIGTIAMVPIPQKRLTNEEHSPILRTVFQDFKESFAVLRRQNSLLFYIMIFSLLNFLANIAIILIGPMVLSTYNSAIYGTVQMAYGISMLLGGFAASLLPSFKNKITPMFLSLSISGLGLMVTGVHPHWMVIAMGMFLFFFFVPYANMLFMTLMQTSIDTTVMGRVSALVTALLSLVTPIAGLLAGPLADHIFEPLMMEDGALGQSFVGQLIGTGPGRGCGVIFILCGLLLLIICTSSAILSAKKTPEPQPVADEEAL